MRLEKWLLLKRAMRRTDIRPNGWWIESPGQAIREGESQSRGVWLEADELDALVAGIDAARKLTQYLMRGPGAQFAGPEGVALTTDADLALSMAVEG